MNGPSRAAVERCSRPRGKALLWAGLLVPPALWMLDLVVMYSLQRYVCRTGAAWLFHLTTVGALVPVLAVGWMAWRAWSDLGEELETAGGGVADRSRFMALWGMVFSAAFALLILAEWVPTLVLGHCSGGGILLVAQ